MDRKSVFLAMFAGLAFSAGASAAMAGDRYDDDGWRPVHACGCVRQEVETVSLPESFFGETGGVGPAFIDTGGSGGGGAVVFAGAAAGASAFASASASARVSVAFNFQNHQHMMQMHMMKMKMMPHYGSRW